MDVVSIASHRNTCLVLPTLGHAVALWPRYRALVHSKMEYLASTKTLLLLRDTHTVLRLWVPYEREPTMPMDQPVARHGFKFVSPYGGRL